MGRKYKSFKRGFNKILPFNPIFWVFVLWYSIASLTWLVRHPKANDMTIITNITKVMFFQTNEKLK